MFPDNAAFVIAVAVFPAINPVRMFPCCFESSVSSWYSCISSSAFSVSDQVIKNLKNSSSDKFSAFWIDFSISASFLSICSLVMPA